MAARNRTATAVTLALLALAWSCGGGSGLTAPTSPAAAAPAGVEGGGEGVSASAAGKVTVCHKGKDLKVAAAAVPAHVAHGDRVGSCAATCPCFTAAALTEVAAQCTSALRVSCPVQYSLSLFCAPTGGGGVVGNLGYFEARLGTNTCSTVTQDPLTGNEIIDTRNLTPQQFESCRQALVGTPFYPTTCSQ
jgi:hypothetical protein